jgi:hypothetical protein
MTLVFLFILVFTDGSFKVSQPHATVESCEAARHAAEDEGMTTSACFSKKAAVL